MAVRGPADQPATALDVRHLRKQYASTGSLFNRRAPYVINALNDVSLSIESGKTLAIVGESGSGKSTLAKVLTGTETATAGEIVFHDENIAAQAVEHRSMDIKKRIQMVFQNPEGTLNPRHTAGYAISRSLRRLLGLSRKEAAERATALLQIVQLPPEMAGRLPRQLSGGQKQRVAIARALAGNPDVIVADEPISALDVSVQAAIINLFIDIQRKENATIVFISHDLAVVRYLADKVAVMYLGRVVEYGDVEQVYSPPFHPYTESLLSAAPTLDAEAQSAPIILEGSVPSPIDIPPGCAFSTRCPRKIGPVCDTTPPPERVHESGLRILCHIPLEELETRMATRPGSQAEAI